MSPTSREPSRWCRSPRTWPQRRASRPVTGGEWVAREPSTDDPGDGQIDDPLCRRRIRSHGAAHRCRGEVVDLMSTSWQPRTTSVVTGTSKRTDTSCVMRRHLAEPRMRGVAQGPRWSDCAPRSCSETYSSPGTGIDIASGVGAVMDSSWPAHCMALEGERTFPCERRSSQSGHKGLERTPRR